MPNSQQAIIWTTDAYMWHHEEMSQINLRPPGIRDKGYHFLLAILWYLLNRLHKADKVNIEFNKYVMFHFEAIDMTFFYLLYATNQEL